MRTIDFRCERTPAGDPRIRLVLNDVFVVLMGPKDAVRLAVGLQAEAARLLGMTPAESAAEQRARG